MASLTDYTNMTTPFGIAELGSTFLTELAREIQQFQTVDPLAAILPQREILTKDVRVEWVEDELRVIGVVQPGARNQLTSHAKAKSFTFTTANFRRGDFLDQDLINHLRAPGGDAEKQYGMDLVQDRLTTMIEQANLMFAVLRAQLMTGGVNYTDYETGYSVTANSGIPAANYYTIGAAGSVVASSATWDDLVNADVVSDFQSLVYKMKIEGKNRPTKCVMSTAMRELISRGTKIRQFLPGNLSGLFNTGLVQWGEDGYVSKICGVEIIDHFMLYDDYVGGVMTRQFMFPTTKVAFFADKHPSLPGQVLGKTYITKGENPRNVPGLYVRTKGAEDLMDPTLPPGLAMQIGMSGLPVLHKPWWCHVVTASTLTAMQNKLGAKYVLS